MILTNNSRLSYPGTDWQATQQIPGQSFLGLLDFRCFLFFYHTIKWSIKIVGPRFKMLIRSLLLLSKMMSTTLSVSVYSFPNIFLSAKFCILSVICILPLQEFGRSPTKVQTTMLSFYWHWKQIKNAFWHNSGQVNYLGLSRLCIVASCIARVCFKILFIFSNVLQSCSALVKFILI